MSETDLVHFDVAVALVTDASQRVLLVFNDRWGQFTLPMSKRRRGRQHNEPATRAALRAAAEALGVPVRILVERARGLRRLPGRLESWRELAEKIYTYTVCRVEPHPDFASHLQIRQPHLWLSPHWILSEAYEPISESARFILRSVLWDFKIPARTQNTSVLIIQREDPTRGRQFLVRWNPDWGYTLPAKRWKPANGTSPEELAAVALAAAERVSRAELGLQPGMDVSLTPARVAELTTHGVSSRKGAPAFGAATDYSHRLFDAQIRAPENLRSKRPLAWATQEEIHAHWTYASQPATDSPLARAGPISRTVYEILYTAGEIVELESPEVLREMKRWSHSIEARLKAASERGET
jgi:hypothetical protein